jgi:DNA-3-methyladenine glycosylase II
MNYFIYGDQEIDYLKSKDKKLAPYIDQIGHIERPVDENLFSSVIHQIIGQQISTKALKTIWLHMQNDLGEINAENLLEAGVDRIQAYGTSFRKAEYICDFATKVKDGTFDIDRIMAMNDEDVIKELTALKGIGPWTAEMILLFGMHRMNVLSYGDLAIIRGMRMVYRHRNISKEQFERLRRRYTPYGSVASLYLWKIAAGVIPDLTDPKDRKRRRK